VKRVIVFSVLFLLCVPIRTLLSSQEKWFSPSGFSIEVRCRSFQPGEIVILSIKGSTEIKNAQIRFLGNKYQLVKDLERDEFLAIIGIDLGVKPGTYPLTIYTQDSAGEWDTLEKQITISVREFPVKRLRVKEEYVTPPVEVRERIRRESELLKSIYQKFTSEWLGEGTFIVPASGKVLDNFGERRIYNDQPRSSHGGVDISAPTGTPVLASNSGEAVLASDLYFSGRTVIIDHGLGLFSLYCHFSKIKVKRGQYVRRGDVIGEVGATGRVTGPHLHWGIKILGSRVDPYSLLSLSFD
jgi:murein DD-endopeptidase MepM/ murein hydrolase activator NlpD